VHSNRYTFDFIYKEQLVVLGGLPGSPRHYTHDLTTKKLGSVREVIIIIICCFF